MNPNMKNIMAPSNNFHPGMNHGMQPNMNPSINSGMHPNMNSSTNSGVNSNIKPNIPSQCTLMNLIYEIGFSLDDIILYLDTHPKDMSALKYYQRLRMEYKDLIKAYTTHYGPLCSKDVYNEKYFTWINKPMPWEGDM